jgi:hypothetical protein
MLLATLETYYLGFEAASVNSYVPRMKFNCEISFIKHL